MQKDLVTRRDWVRRSRVHSIIPSQTRFSRSKWKRYRKPSPFTKAIIWFCILNNVFEFRLMTPRRLLYRNSAGFVRAQEIADSKQSDMILSRNLTLRKKVSESAMIPAAEEPNISLGDLFVKAGKRALGGGIPGAAAGAIQVLSLMWLRTIINYQCRYGTTFQQALRTLLHDGGISRLYRGLGFALFQAPVSRFVSTAANDGVNLLLAHLPYTKFWGPGRTTVVASIVVGAFRLLLMLLQVDSLEGFRSLMHRVGEGKISVLYSGALAVAISAVLGHYPWFATYNWLSGSQWVHDIIPSKLLRNAGIGIVASIVSDTVVNVMRVIKTTKQSLSSRQTTSYADTIRIILAADGWIGLFGRGLRTRIMANAIQSIVFTVVWRGLSDHWRRRNLDSEDATAA